MPPKESLVDAQARAARESLHAHRLSVVLQLSVLGEPDAVRSFSSGGDRYELRLYASMRSEGGYVLIIARPRVGKASTRVAALEEEYRHWLQWTPPSNCGDERMLMRDAIFSLLAVRNASVRSAVGPAP